MATDIAAYSARSRVFRDSPKKSSEIATYPRNLRVMLPTPHRARV